MKKTSQVFVLFTLLLVPVLSEAFPGIPSTGAPVIDRGLSQILLIGGGIAVTAVVIWCIVFTVQCVKTQHFDGGKAAVVYGASFVCVALTVSGLASLGII